MKGSLALWLAFIAPLAVAGYCILIFWTEDEAFSAPATFRAWSELGNLATIFWALLMLPLFVTLQSALLAGLEHRNDQWKNLYALPVPRWSIYAAKQVGVFMLMALGHLALLGSILLGGGLLSILRPSLGFGASIPLDELVHRVVVIYLASWLIMAIHTWVGLRWQSFVIALGAGCVLTVAGVAIISSQWGSFYPWALPGTLVNQMNKGIPFPWPEFLVGCLGGIAVAALGCWDVTRRDVR
jgi:hypothetical protein